MSRRMATAILGNPIRHPPRKNSVSCSQISLGRQLDVGVIRRGLAAVERAVTIFDSATRLALLCYMD
jgi:hypothetical protein